MALSKLWSTNQSFTGQPPSRFVFYAYEKTGLVTRPTPTPVVFAFGHYYRGRVLDVNIVSLERTAELLYSTPDVGQGIRHFRIRPSSEDSELVFLRLKVENHTATSAIVNIDSQAAELRGLGKDTLERISIQPLNVNGLVEEVSAPVNPGAERSIVFLWNVTLQDGTTEAFVLRKDFGLEGWLVFEAPKNTKFTEFRWRAGDSLTIDF